MKRGGNCILIVEDDWDFQSAVAQLLMELGYYVAVVPDGSRAKNFLQQKPAPALVVTDLHMPICDGLELRQWMLDQPLIKKIPAILFSGDVDAMNKAKTLRFSAIVSKTNWLNALPPLVAKFIACSVVLT